MTWEELIGKKVLAYQGYKTVDMWKKPKCELDFILFDDQETFLELRKQDRSQKPEEI